MQTNRREFLFIGFAHRLNAAFDRSIIGANTAMEGYGLFEAIDALRKMGFETIEIHPMGVPEPTPGKFPGFEFDHLSPAVKQRISKSLEGFRHVTTHLPYSGLNPFSEVRETAEVSCRAIETALEATAHFRAELAVLHAIPAKGRRTEDFWPTMVQRIRQWGDFAGARSFKLAIETGYPASVADFVRLVREVDHPAVGCCIDVGHQRGYKELVAKVKPENRATPAGIRAYNDTTHAIIDALGPKVIHFHVHDIDPPTWQEHRPLGTGFVDYPRLIKKLREINYQGLLVLEIAAPGTEIEKYLIDSKRRLESYL